MPLPPSLSEESVSRPCLVAAGQQLNIWVIWKVLQKIACSMTTLACMAPLGLQIFPHIKDAHRVPLETLLVRLIY